MSPTRPVIWVKWREKKNLVSFGSSMSLFPSVLYCELLNNILTKRKPVKKKKKKLIYSDWHICNCLKLDSGTTIFAIAVILQPYPTGPRQHKKQTIHRFGDKATASASPSRVQNFKMASLSFVSYGSPLFAILKCNSCSISSCLILPLPADHKAWQRNSE